MRHARRFWEHVVLDDRGTGIVFLGVTDKPLPLNTKRVAFQK